VAKSRRKSGGDDPEKLKRRRKRSKYVPSAYDQALVHDWLIAQCLIDPELRRIYEEYIGPIDYVRTKLL